MKGIEVDGSVNRNTDPARWLYAVPGRKKGYVLVLALLQAASGSTGVIYALFIRNIVDSAVAGDRAAFLNSVIGIIILVLVQLGLNALIRWVHELASCDFENCFKQRLAENIMTREYAAVSATHSGEWMNRLTNDTKVVAESYVDVLPGLVGTTVRLVSAVVMIIVLQPWFAYILIPGGILLVVLTWAFRRVLKSLHKNIQEQDGRLRVFLQERIESLLMIKSFAAEEETIREAEEYMARHKASRMKRNLFSNFCNVGFGAAMQGMYLLGVIYCAYGILTGTVTYGTMAAVMQLIGQVQAPFANISGYLPRYYAMLASAERLMEIEQEAPDCDGAPMSIDEVKDAYQERIKAVGLRNVSFAYPETGEVALQSAGVRNDNVQDSPAASSGSGHDVTAAPRGSDSASGGAIPAALTDITLDIEKGFYTALTGHSGCGKSTALKMLLCMYKPDKGERYIRYIDNNAEPLTARFRRLFAYVPQGNLLISGTIRDVVTFADPAGRNDDERIREALKIACAEDFVRDLENGLDTLLGEHGTGLSEGQMQRLAIARAIFSESPVLLLDEATSALDGRTEAALLTNLRRLTDRTVVIVTHRPAALEICDHIYQFTENGMVTEK